MSHLWIDQSKIPEFSHIVITVFMSHIKIPAGDTFRCVQLKFFLQGVTNFSSLQQWKIFNTLPKKAKNHIKTNFALGWTKSHDHEISCKNSWHTTGICYSLFSSLLSLRGRLQETRTQHKNQFSPSCFWILFDGEAGGEWEQWEVLWGLPLCFSCTQNRHCVGAMTKHSVCAPQNHSQFHPK